VVRDLFQPDEDPKPVFQWLIQDLIEN
jgi:hypothetical protein